MCQALFKAQGIEQETKQARLCPTELRTKAWTQAIGKLYKHRF